MRKEGEEKRDSGGGGVRDLVGCCDTGVEDRVCA
jgi:hypothetical protein